MGYKPVELIQITPSLREHTSPSTLGLFMNCQRAWGFKKLLGIREVKTRPWLEFGKEVEYYQQKYLEGYAIPQDTEGGRRALSGLHLLPDPKMCITIEHQAQINIDTRLVAPNTELVYIQGARDLTVFGFGDQPEHERTWHLYDYKTTRGNTRKKGGEWDYCMDPDELLADIQGNFYAWDLMSNKPDLFQVPGRWVYTLTDLKKQPAARATDALFNYEDTKARMQGFIETADHHRYLTRAFKRQPFDVQGLPANGDFCEQFGGCPYRPAVGGPCKQPNRNLGALLMQGMPMPPNGQGSSIEDMLSQRRTEGLQAGAPAGYPVPPPVGPPAMQGMPPAQPPMMAPPPQPTQQAAPLQMPPGTKMNGHTWSGQQWIPDQAPQMPPPPPMQAPQQQQFAPHAPHLPPEAHQPPPMMPPPQMQPQMPPPGLPPGVIPQIGAPPQPAAPGKRKRRTQAEMAAAAGQTSVPMPDQPEDETDERAQFMRACVLACSGNVDSILAQNPASLNQVASNAVQYANLVWQYLQHSGA